LISLMDGRAEWLLAILRAFCETNYFSVK
jgi:hypothetical protein